MVWDKEMKISECETGRATLVSNSAELNGRHSCSGKCVVNLYGLNFQLINVFRTHSFHVFVSLIVLFRTNSIHYSKNSDTSKYCM